MLHLLHQPLTRALPDADVSQSPVDYSIEPGCSTPGLEGAVSPKRKQTPRFQKFFFQKDI